mgnify:CR=1 FL=1
MTKRPITVHVAPVGISLFDKILTKRSTLTEEAVGDHDLGHDIFTNRERVHDLEGELSDPQQEADRVSERLVKETSGEGRAREALEELVEVIAPGQWPWTISAELTSLHANRGDHQFSSKNKIDETALLIASDTGRGLRAALFNALAMTDGDVDRVDYLPTPDSAFHVEPGRVSIVRLSGLDAHNPGVDAQTPGLDGQHNKRFLGAMRELSAFGPYFKEALRNPESTCRFHLTGGFRVAMPFLLGFAQALRSLYGGRISAHAQYEFSSSPRSIELPLSSPRTDELKGKLVGAGDDGYFAEAPPGDAVWEGYAYEYLEDKGRWRLTPFGMALRELIPSTRQET